MFSKVRKYLAIHKCSKAFLNNSLIIFEFTGVFFTKKKLDMLSYYIYTYIYYDILLYSIGTKIKKKINIINIHVNKNVYR